MARREISEKSDMTTPRNRLAAIERRLAKMERRNAELARQVNNQNRLLADAIAAFKEIDERLGDLAKRTATTTSARRQQPYCTATHKTPSRDLVSTRRRAARSPPPATTSRRIADARCTTRASGCVRVSFLRHQYIEGTRNPGMYEQRSKKYLLT